MKTIYREIDKTGRYGRYRYWTLDEKTGDRIIMLPAHAEREVIQLRARLETLKPKRS